MMMKVLKSILVSQLAAQVLAQQAASADFTSFWGSTISTFTPGTTTLSMVNYDISLAVTWGSRPAYNFTMDVPTPNPTRQTCTDLSRIYTCDADDGAVLSPGDMFNSTFQTETTPTISFTSNNGNDANRYAVVMYDVSMKIAHWACVNIQGSGSPVASSTFTDCYSLFVSPYSQSSYATAWFPPGGPAVTPASSRYGFLLFEQNDTMTGLPASLQQHGTGSAGTGTGNYNFNFPALAGNESWTLRGANWFSVQGNAYSAELLANRGFSSFADSGTLYNCATMDDAHCAIFSQSATPTPTKLPTSAPTKTPTKTPTSAPTAAAAGNATTPTSKPTSAPTAIPPNAGTLAPSPPTPAPTAGPVVEVQMTIAGVTFANLNDVQKNGIATDVANSFAASIQGVSASDVSVVLSSGSVVADCTISVAQGGAELSNITDEINAEAAAVVSDVGTRVTATLSGCSTCCTSTCSSAISTTVTRSASVVVQTLSPTSAPTSAPTAAPAGNGSSNGSTGSGGTTTASGGGVISHATRTWGAQAFLHIAVVLAGLSLTPF